jgi:hypothetical protein
MVVSNQDKTNGKDIDDKNIDTKDEPKADPAPKKRARNRNKDKKDAKGNKDKGAKGNKGQKKGQDGKPSVKGQDHNPKPRPAPSSPIDVLNVASATPPAPGTTSPHEFHRESGSLLGLAEIGVADQDFLRLYPVNLAGWTQEVHYIIESELKSATESYSTSMVSRESLWYVASSTLILEWATGAFFTGGRTMLDMLGLSGIRPKDIHALCGTDSGENLPLFSRFSALARSYLSPQLAVDGNEVVRRLPILLIDTRIIGHSVHNMSITSARSPVLTPPGTADQEGIRECKIAATQQRALRRGIATRYLSYLDCGTQDDVFEEKFDYDECCEDCVLRHGRYFANCLASVCSQQEGVNPYRGIQGGITVNQLQQYLAAVGGFPDIGEDFVDYDARLALEPMEFYHLGAADHRRIYTYFQDERLVYLLRQPAHAEGELHYSLPPQEVNVPLRRSGYDRPSLSSDFLSYDLTQRAPLYIRVLVDADLIRWIVSTFIARDNKNTLTKELDCLRNCAPSDRVLPVELELPTPALLIPRPPQLDERAVFGLSKRESRMIFQASQFIITDRKALKDKLALRLLRYKPLITWKRLVIVRDGPLDGIHITRADYQAQLNNPDPLPSPDYRWRNMREHESGFRVDNLLPTNPVLIDFATRRDHADSSTFAEKENDHHRV